jgi:hypothetical protein
MVVVVITYDDDDGLAANSDNQDSVAEPQAAVVPGGRNCRGRTPSMHRYVTLCDYIFCHL